MQDGFHSVRNIGGANCIGNRAVPQDEVGGGMTLFESWSLWALNVAILKKGQRENGCACEGATRKNDVDMSTRGIKTEIA